ncbi:MAG TPA: mechanosensitive ion channel domain-containing protein [Acetobacteraceae bacterium]|nr:mechanosensitive ion channel domain-containing protein [Acetobacteraceae bacterium]
MLDQDAQHLVTDVQALLPLLISNALHVVAAILILIIGFWVAGRAQGFVVRSLSKTPHLDTMLRGFFGNIVRYFILTITVLAVLSQFGIQTTSLVTVIGAAGLAIGLALQGTLSHLAAGVMLLIFRPFRIGNHVQIGGADGIVKELSLFWTEIVTSDNVQVIIPNGSVWGQQMRNFSVYPQSAATAQVRFRLPDADAAIAREKIETIVRANPKVLDTPAPSVLLDRNATDNALEFVVTFAPADGAGNAAAVKSEIIEAVYEGLEAPASRTTTLPTKPSPMLASPAAPAESR